MSDYDQRFGGIGRLYSSEGLDRLRRAHVAVIGIGGVGSWTAEALARSGIGTLTLVDLDDICVTNINRQLHALDGSVGLSKVEVMAERIGRIHPEGEVKPVVRFLTESSAAAIFAEGFDYVVDAIDSVPNKCLIIARCRDEKIPVITVGGAGGKRNPCAIQVEDLGRARHDRLLRQVRKQLRSAHGFPKGEKAKFGVDCVYSMEEMVYPWKNGEVCAAKEEGSDLRLTCEGGLGTASFVTGAFGFAAAARVVEGIAYGTMV